MPSPFTATSSTTTSTLAKKLASRREFIVHSQGEDGYVEVTSTDTLLDVRRHILEDFDAEQLPSSSSSSSEGEKSNTEFSFRVNGIRISAKQEARKIAFDLLDQNVSVEIVSKQPPNKKRGASLLDEDGDVDGENNEIISAKRPKTDGDSGHVTPFDSVSTSATTSKSEDQLNGEDDLDENDKKGEEKNKNDNNNNDVDDSSTIATGDSSTLDPVQLDGKFASGGDSKSKEDGLPNNKNDTKDDDSDATMELQLAMNRNNNDKKKGELKKSDMDMELGDGELKNDDSMDLELEGEEDLVASGKNKQAKAAESALNDDIETSFSNNDNSTDDITNDDIFEVSNNEEEPPNDPHKESNLAKQKSKQVLKQLATILTDNTDFCSDNRRKEWLEDVNTLLEKSTPQTVFGVLGNTGVGKSSLLNGLLDEAAVLPTSGSRGCTAAVVELVFHSDLLKGASGDEADGNGAVATSDVQQPKNVPVYRGEVEFITLEDWRKELKTLVDECSTQEGTIYALPPQEDTSPDAAQAWSKIEQVYGKGAMEPFRRDRASSQFVFNRLAHDLRVKNLLTATVPGQAYNSIVVEVGEVVAGSDEAKELMKGHGQTKARTKGKKKKWAQEFRKRINTYVYRAGNGEQPQTWPLIRKVQLRGPWTVLSTGAVLVDLPGVRDSNAARAKVAENYLQNCNQIAIVAPIKRAVDDGTAKELLGEQFKRRLLMDGNYGNVFFICTQTDDIEATETMRDHADVAQEVEGRYEKMTEMADGINDYEKQLNPLLAAEEDLQEQVEDAKQQYKEALDDLKQAQEDANDDDSYVEDVNDTDLLDNLKAVLAENKLAFVKAKQALSSWQSEHSSTIESIQGKCDRLQKKLKALCATVRNEYSKSCLQADFKSGLKELYRKDDDDGGDQNSNSNGTERALPDDFNMDVFCISANDYLKIMKIKPSRDGPANCFSNPRDTQIPLLREFVHETTARFCLQSVKTYVENTNDLLDQMKLLAADVEDVPTGRNAFRMKNLFETAMKDNSKQIDPIARDFQKVIDEKIKRSLVTSLSTGAKKGSAVAMSTVESWGSKNRRSKSERRPDKNGLYYSTYNAVTRREGVYTSGSAGAIDFNQELCDPMEKEFSTEWQSVLDSTIKRLLQDAEKNIIQLSTSTAQAFAQSLRNNGVDGSRLSSMLNTANRSGISGLKAAFAQMSAIAVNAQRDLSRELLPAVKEKMAPAYHAAVSVPRGSGTFMRMKDAMAQQSNQAVNGMFDDAMRKLLSGIEALVKRLKQMIVSTSDVISKSMNTVFSICWDDQQAEALIDPEMQKRMRECRDKLLPKLNELVEIQNGACEMLGIEREEVELDVMGVESFEDMLKRKKEEAIKNGDMFDLCDSDAELDIKPKAKVKVKGERKDGRSSTTYSASASADTDVIDLCDSDEDDDDYGKKPAAKPNYSRGVKEEACI